jgi:hypothetical protein
MENSKIKFSLLNLGKILKCAIQDAAYDLDFIFHNSYCCMSSRYCCWHRSFSGNKFSMEVLKVVVAMAS